MSDWLPPVDRFEEPTIVEPQATPDYGDTPTGGMFSRLAARALTGKSKTTHKTINRNRVENNYYGGGFSHHVAAKVGPVELGVFPRYGKKKRR